MPDIRTLIRLSSPRQLLLATFAYSLGVGISKYLGRPVHLVALGLGLLVILAVQVATFLLVEYFRFPLMPLTKDETPRSREALRSGLFQSSMVLLTGAGAVILTLFIARLLSSPAWIFISLIVISFIVFSIPPLHLSETGYGELVQAIVLGMLIPASAFFIQNSGFHRLLAFVTFPLTLLALAYFLVCDFPSYATDLKYGRYSMLIRLTWQRAIYIHPILILVPFLFFSVAPLLGFPWSLVWPVFLALPFSVGQLVWVNNIAKGGKTLWRLLIPLSTVTLCLVFYLLGLSFWIR